MDCARPSGRLLVEIALAELLPAFPDAGGHLKPLGKPMQNARKLFATLEIERMSSDPDWLDKAIRIVEKQIQEMNRKQRDKEQSQFNSSVF